MAKKVSRLASVYVSTDDVTYTKIGRMASGTLSRTTGTEEATDYDSGDDEEFEHGFRNSTLQIECNRDDADTGQEMVKTSHDDQTKLYYRWRYQDNVGDDEFVQQGLVTNFDDKNTKKQLQGLSISVQLSGAETTQAQS